MEVFMKTFERTLAYTAEFSDHCFLALFGTAFFGVQPLISYLIMPIAASKITYRRPDVDVDYHDTVAITVLTVATVVTC